MKLLDAYAAKLRENWAFSERLQVEDRYRAAMREVLERPAPLLA